MNAINNKSSPKILLSIIIPTYNRNKSLNDLLDILKESIHLGNFEEIIEVIIIDDASTLAISLPTMPCKMILKKNEFNLGAPLSRKKGLKYANGNFIHFHDSDDSITPTWLSEVTDVLIKQPRLDILLTGRIVIESTKSYDQYHRFYHRAHKQPKKVAHRLNYWNSLGPLGGVTFSRKSLENIKYKNIASCQDWQMYISALQHSNILTSMPDIQFIFNKSGNDRISQSPRKKILGHLQLSRVTSTKTPFGRSIRLFYLRANQQHVASYQGIALKFYEKNKFKIEFTYWVVAGYSFLPKKVS